MNKINYSYLPIILWLCSCANPQPPSGGPPDKTPPLIIEYSPPDGSINFSGNTLMLKFNKYMEKNKVLENISVSPANKLGFDWSGKELEIEFKEKLDSNTSYVFSLGTDYTDIYSNPPDEAFSLVFSTGSKLDSGEIRGRLYSDKPAGTYIFCYRTGSINPDTLDPFHSSPDYYTQVGTNGNFRLQALKKDKYRLMAVKKSFRGEFIVSEGDEFAAASRDLEISDSSAFINIKLGKTIDRTGPVLFDARSFNQFSLDAEFSEKLDSFSFTKNNFLLSDSAGKLKIPIVSAFLSISEPSRITLITGEKLDTSINWRLEAVNLTDTCIKDTNGIALDNKSKTVNFRAEPGEDTIPPRLVAIPFSDSSKNISLLPVLHFIFDSGLKEQDFSNRFSLFKSPDGEAIPFKISLLSGNTLAVEIQKQLESNFNYELDFRLDSLGFKPDKKYADTTVRLYFKTIDARSNGSASGKIKNLPPNPPGSHYIVNFIPSDKRGIYSTIVNDSAEWRISSIPPGSYQIEIFCDLDGDGKYSHGKPFPYQAAEPFSVIEAPVIIKPRWEIGDLPLVWK